MMNKETIKEFLKPNKWKVIVFVIFVLVNAGLIYTRNPVSPLLFQVGEYIEEYGIPFIFYTYHGCPIFPPEMLKDIDCPTTTFNVYPFILDIVVWWFLSCLIVYGYDTKIRSKIDTIQLRNNITKFLSPNWIKIILLFIFGILPYSLIGPFLFYFQLINFIIFGILFLLITYVFSCLIIFIYDKFRTKK